MQTVHLLLLDGFVLVDALGPLQVFDAADTLLEARGTPRTYNAMLHSIAGMLATSSSGTALPVSALPQQMRETHGTLMVAGSAHHLMAEHRKAFEAAQHWILRNRSRFARVASIGKDAFLLLHQLRYPQCPQPDRGDDTSELGGEARWMAANAMAGIELALAMVKHDFGEALAIQVASRLASTYGSRTLLALGGSFLSEGGFHARLDALRGWIEAHVREPLPVARLAGQMSMSLRSFERHYLLATGETPARTVLRLRVEKACLQISTWPSQTLKAVAQQCGFSSEEVMRRAFIRLVGVSPRRYRAQQVGVPPQAIG